MEMLKATIRSFNADAYTATVQISGSLATWLDGVPVARNIAANHLTPGRSLRPSLLRRQQPVRRRSAGGVRVVGAKMLDNPLWYASFSWPQPRQQGGNTSRLSAQWDEP